MFIRFLCIFFLAQSLILGCRGHDGTEAPSQVPTSSVCPKPALKGTELSLKQAVAQLGPIRKMSTAAQPLLMTVKSLTEIPVWTSKDYTLLKKASLDLIQKATIRDFLDVGRNLALAAIQDLSPLSSGPAQGQHSLSPHAARHLFSQLASSPPPSDRSRSGQAHILRYVLFIQLWSDILQNRVQIRPWWLPHELRWFTEAKVLGHFGRDIEQRWQANKALILRPNYPSKWNTELLSVWRGQIKSVSTLKALASEIPTDCLTRYVREYRHE